jgi:3-mercaptopyruvate sulfurtransferase SseA
MMNAFLAAVIAAAVLMFAGSASAAEGAGGAETYQSLLISAEWVSANIGKVVLIDARAQALYKGQQGHLPGAVNAEWTYFANMNGKAGDANYGAVFDAAAMAKKLGDLGIDGKKEVVVYGDGGDWGNAGFVAWVLRMAGFKNARIMDGGFTVYRASGGKTDNKTTVNKPVKYPDFQYDVSYHVGTDWMKENYNKPEVKLVDVRSPQEYTGQIHPFGERRPGHIPGAVNLSWDNVYTDDFKILPEGELAAMFEKAGFTDKNQTIVCYDTSGVRGAFVAMIFRLAGYADARAYNPSYQAWCADADTEITQGPNP